jgi:hypothetical protein
MLMLFNYNQVEYTTFLMNSYDSLWQRSYDYFLNITGTVGTLFKEKVLGKSSDSIDQFEALENLKKKRT